MERKTIGIVGVGLIGGSLAIRLHEKKISSKILGVDENNENLLKAIELELIDESSSLEDAIELSEVIILAVPADKMINLLPEILNKISNQQIVIDVGSVKSSLTNSIKNHPKRGRYVATHPMWGTEYSGPTAAIKGAFENKAVVICDAEKCDEDALTWVKYMYQKIGMRLLEMKAEPHDKHAAYVSHISHITSFALANTVLEKEKKENAIFELASGGFESTVRLAKSNADTWVPIFLENKQNIIEVLNEHIEQLIKFKTVITEGAKNELKNLIEDANKISKIIK